MTYLYDLRVEIPATEVAVLVDALDGEDLSLKKRLGADELRRQLDRQELDVHVVDDEPWPTLRRDLEILSTYLSEPISAREVHVDGDAVNGWTILASRGRTERLALSVRWDAAAGQVIDDGIDKEAARARWGELPDWVRATLASRLGLSGP